MSNEISEKFKKISINHFSVINQNGSINIEQTLANFKNALAEQKNNFNQINKLIDQYVTDILNIENMSMANKKSIKFYVKSRFDKLDIPFEFKYFDTWIDNAIDKQYIYSKSGSAGGIQTWDNAKNIISQNLISKKKISQGDNPLEKAEQLMRNNK